MQNLSAHGALAIPQDFGKNALADKIDNAVPYLPRLIAAIRQVTANRD